MIKILKILFLNFLKNYNPSFWEYLERQQKIKAINHDLELVKEGLIARSDKDFVDYAAKKLLDICKKQQKIY